MIYLRGFNESMLDFNSELKKFCDDSLIHLYDEGFHISVLKILRRNLSRITFNLYGEDGDFGKFRWADIKHDFIPFLERLEKFYDIEKSSIAPNNRYPKGIKYNILLVDDKGNSYDYTISDLIDGKYDNDILEVDLIHIRIYIKMGIRGFTSEF